MVVKQPKFTRVEEPTLLCNQAPLTIRSGVNGMIFALISVTHDHVKRQQKYTVDE